ncbi:class II aldolase/adducin family protein [Azospirillum sp.]|uniref:class II aldolase/adducin family protein n=1 Tax=Azospirillum sp. TaxID=34012 RepID=UPI002D631EC7|nr:class II aldolase/adducin family protein [Azospirillum sp.]HYD71182.1 class II aldolase/adducin family protein [Azospirillum sp.]
MLAPAPMKQEPMGQAPMEEAPIKEEWMEQDRLVRVAARALARAGLVHAYGHCSQRLDADRFLVCAARPMGSIAAGECGVVVPVAGPLPDGVLGEVRIHQRIYAARPDVGGICRSMPPNVMALGTLRRTPRPRHGFGAYFAPGVPLWDDPQLIRSDERAAAVAETLGMARAVVMRGNGAVTAGRDLMQAVVLTWYLEDAARVELEVLKTGLRGAELSLEEAAERATEAGRIFERMWDFLTDGDPEHAAPVPG